MIGGLLVLMGHPIKKGGVARVILEGLNKLTLEQEICFSFETSKKQVEYKALIVRL